MLRPLLECFLFLALALPSDVLTTQVTAQVAPSFPDDKKETPPDQVRLPNGKLQQDEILKQEHNRSLQDARQLVELSQALQKDIEQAGATVLSISSIHRTEEIEKLAKRIRSRMRGY